MVEDVLEITQILESLIEDSPNKVKFELEFAIRLLKSALDQEGLIKVQEQLEVIVSMNNVDSYVRNEVYNAISLIESLL